MLQIERGRVATFATAFHCSWRELLCYKMVELFLTTIVTSNKYVKIVGKTELAK